MPRYSSSGGSSADHRRSKFIAGLTNTEILSGRVAAAKYIVRHFSLDVLEAILGHLNTALLPSSGVAGSTPTPLTAGVAASAGSAVRNLTTLLEPFSVSVEGFTPIKQECTRLLLERWDAITSWMQFLLRSSGRSHTLQSLGVISTISVICFIVHAVDVDLYREAILSAECTADIIITALCKVDRNTGKYFVADEVAGDGDGECQIAEGLLRLVQASTESRDIVASRIKSASVGRRRRLSRLSFNALNRLSTSHPLHNIPARGPEYSG